MRMMAFVVLSLLPSLAVADEPLFEALGQAPVVAGDRVRARERALDEAVRQAVEQATATVLEPGQLVARSSDLRLRIYPKARSYVTTYRVLDEGEQPPGTFQVHLSAQVATDRLARDLAGGVALPTRAPRPRAVVCAAVHVPEGAIIDVADLGSAGEKTVRELMVARGVDPMPGPSPCDDGAAAGVARSGTAQGALALHLEAAPAGEIRGTELVSASARATLHLIEPDGRVSGEGVGEREAYGPELGRAALAAARAAVSEAVRPLQPALGQRWASDGGARGGVLVRVTGVQRYAEYVALTRALGALPGVATVEPRRFVRGQIDLLLHTASSVAQLAAHLGRLPPPGLHVNVQAAGDALQIQVESDAVPERG